ncbi:hypothetical protein PY310_04360 [Pseudarthrobacter sp. H3Y2-7]|uniref:hypothetical protein n=1 Tax=Pseudarthrobacter naphthalenicus TaxID=3031328 RepID=UPI0023AE76E2|nr:hypothetical protein [Pseudarthrobacter sp. H3Y2-7]MDE8667812.1 hypothetical protein [Pseudarthrobacter sp. H3Y2-7]
MMKKRRMMAALMAIATTLGVSGVVAARVAVAGDVPVATHSHHSTAVQTSLPSGVPSAPAAAPPAALSAQGAAPAAALPDVASIGDPPGKGKAQSLGEALRQPHGLASVGAEPGDGKPQSLSEALRKPHGVAAAGVTPEGAGVNDGTTKQAADLPMRSLARGEQDAGVNDAARTGGCAPGYGDGRSCLPVVPPSAAQHAGHNVQVVWTCEELLTLFPQGIPLQVRGVDPLGLDKDGNGIACA